MKNAIKELLENDVKLELKVNLFVKSSKTYIEKNTLYYKNIPEGLFLLTNNMYTDLKELKNSFRSFGTMVDISRGAVFKTSYFKELICKHALMGLNQMWIYIEDVYPIEGVPTFGYFRGKYTKEELQEIIRYAGIFDIEIIPCIQALGHHGQFLRWANSNKYKDMDQVLISNDDTFELVESMILWAKDVFSTDKIHLGMDETFGLGFGNYFKKYGFKEPLDIFLNHLNKVNDLALKHGYKEIMIWSDMFFRFLSEVNYYYDTNIVITEDIISKIPTNISLVLWDYYNFDSNRVSKMIKNHLELNRKVIFASGTWIWTRFTYDKKQTDRTAKMHLEECIKANIDDFILTQWMDDGAYGNHITTLLGVFEIAADLYTNDYNKDVYEFITNVKYNDSLELTSINNTTLSQVGMLWDDPILSIYLANYTLNISDNFTKYIDEQKAILDGFSKDNLNSMEYIITRINYNKLLLRKNILDEYKEHKISLKNIEYINSIRQDLLALNNIYSILWDKQYKMFGLEVIQSRLATQVFRINELEHIITNYKVGDKILVLEEDIVENEYLSLKYDDIAFSFKSF